MNEFNHTYAKIPDSKAEFWIDGVFLVIKTARGEISIPWKPVYDAMLRHVRESHAKSLKSHPETQK